MWARASRSCRVTDSRGYVILRARACCVIHPGDVILRARACCVIHPGHVILSPRLLRDSSRLCHPESPRFSSRAEGSQSPQLFGDWEVVPSRRYGRGRPRLVPSLVAPIDWLRKSKLR